MSLSTSSLPHNSPWHLGNTTVRSPYRLADAVRVLADSDIHGAFNDEAAQARYLQLLHDEGFLRQVAEGETASWNGRKWRSAMYQYGFITPELTRGLPAGAIDARILAAAAGMPGISGRQYELTPAGRRLASADSEVRMQECFLRALLAYRVPTSIERRLHQGVPSFSPLRVVLKTLQTLSERGLESRISLEEMASLVMFVKSEAGVSTLVDEIENYRARRAASENKRGFDNEFRKEAWRRNGEPVSRNSMQDYADVNFRYLKATGLFSGSRSGLFVSPGRQRTVDLILSQQDDVVGDDAYLRRLWEGAPLPTDNASEAERAIRTLEEELRAGGKRVEVGPLVGVQPPDLEQIRLDLLQQRLYMDEERFAREQREAASDISELLELLQSGTKRKEEFGRECPAYLEWAVWRAFLAINTLCNDPWDVRKFQIGSDLRPLSSAASRRPDMVCEFEDFVLVVEVTFTENSRQEAAEGEPVRRHVYDVTKQHAESTGKPVFALFVAPKIDPNTAETFARGTYTTPAGGRLDLSIVPITLEQFANLFAAGFARTEKMGPAEILNFLTTALSKKSMDGEDWKREIALCVEQSIRAMGSQSVREVAS